jgi:hypothetical protein
MMAVLDRKTSNGEIQVVLRALKDEHARGTIGNAEARLPRACYGTADVDVLLSGLYKVPVLTFKHCSNGGGVALYSWCGLQYYEKCEFHHNVICCCCCC